jgi:hypothetical protein
MASPIAISEKPDPPDSKRYPIARKLRRQRIHTKDDLCTHFAQYIEVHILNKSVRFPHGFAGRIRQESSPLASCQRAIAGRPRI